MDFNEKVLDLGLRLSASPPEMKPRKTTPVAAVETVYKEHDRSLNLTLSGESYDLFPAARSDEKKGKSFDLYRQDSGASSFSSVKRVINGGDEAEETERLSSRVSDEDDDGSDRRKKLRLSKAQSALLEESFKQHSTLNPIQKQELSHELKLTPRQVEVWFQNRRARTKLKQTEVDCEFLKKFCESLTDENRRLQKELQELKAIHSTQPFYMQIPAATLTMCPSCERISAASAAAVVPETSPKNSFIIAAAAPKQNLFNPSVSSLLINQ